MITAKKTFSSKSQVININSINLFLLIPYHFQISLSSPTATSRLHKLINFLGSARRINRLLLVTTNRQKTGPQKKMAATMKRAGKATIDCHFRLRLAGSFFPAQPCYENSYIYAKITFTIKFNLYFRAGCFVYICLLCNRYV